MARREKAPTEAQWGQRQKLVEEFALLDQQVEAFKPFQFRHAKLRQIILTWFRSTPPEEEILVAGLSCNVIISARDQIKNVSLDGKRALFKLWGPQNFVARAVVLLKCLPDPKDELGLYTVTALSGPRHLHPVAKKKSAESAA